MGNKNTNGNFSPSLYELIEDKAPSQISNLKTHLGITTTRLLEILSHPEKMNINEMEKICKITNVFPSDLHIHYKAGRDAVSVDQMNNLIETLEG